jgi:hypothetical protein
MRQDKQDVAPSCLSVAPCSGPSRRGLATLEKEATLVYKPCGMERVESMTTPSRDLECLGVIKLAVTEVAPVVTVSEPGCDFWQVKLTRFRGHPFV